MNGMRRMSILSLLITVPEITAFLKSFQMNHNFSNPDKNISLDKGTDHEVRDEYGEPELYKIILLNDDYTTKEFVVSVLELVFRKPPREANALMMDVHRKGQAVVGIFPRDIGLTKVARVSSMAEQAEYPLQSVLEKV